MGCGSRAHLSCTGWYALVDELICQCPCHTQVSWACADVLHGLCDGFCSSTQYPNTPFAPRCLCKCHNDDLTFANPYFVSADAQPAPTQEAEPAPSPYFISGEVNRPSASYYARWNDDSGPYDMDWPGLQQTIREPEPEEWQNLFVIYRKLKTGKIVLVYSSADFDKAYAIKDRTENSIMISIKLEVRESQMWQ